jgi:hypothetical protein
MYVRLNATQTDIDGRSYCVTLVCYVAKKFNELVSTTGKEPW